MQDVLKKVHAHMPYHLLPTYLEMIVQQKLNLEIYFSHYVLQNLDKKKCAEEAKILAQNGLKVTFHAPFIDLSPGSVDEKIREVTSFRFKQILDLVPSFSPRAILLTISRWDLGLLIRTGPSLGDLLMAAAVLCWACYAILVRRLVTRFDPIVTTFYSFLTCVLVLTPFQGAEILRHGLAIDRQGWLAILYMGVFPTFIGYLVQQQAIKHIGVSRTALFINLVPLLVMALAVSVLGESFFRLNLVSAAMIILAVAGFNLSPGKAGPAPRPAAGPGRR